MARSLEDFLTSLPVGSAVRSKLLDLAESTDWECETERATDERIWRRALSSRLQAEIRSYLADDDPLHLAELAELIEAMAMLHDGGLANLAILRQALRDEMGEYNTRDVLTRMREPTLEGRWVGNLRPDLKLPGD